jgi:hypothetical protein
MVAIVDAVELSDVSSYYFITYLILFKKKVKHSH